MIVRGAAEACLSLHMSTCHIVGNLMHWFNNIVFLNLKVGFVLANIVNTDKMSRYVQPYLGLPCPYFEHVSG